MLVGAGGDLRRVPELIGDFGNWRTSCDEKGGGGVTEVIRNELREAGTPKRVSGCIDLFDVLSPF
jgi:hypothetical protein